MIADNLFLLLVKNRAEQEEYIQLWQEPDR